MEENGKLKKNRNLEKNRTPEEMRKEKEKGKMGATEADGTNEEEKFQRHQFIRRLIIVTKLHKKIIEREVNQTGVYRSQHQILMYVADHPNVSQKDIALLHHASPATIAVSLKKLEKGGYLVRRMAEDDNRVNQILLTEKGRTTVEKSKQMFRQIEAQALEGISDEEMQQVEAVLRHLFENYVKILPDTEKEEMNW
ncbi:MAG: MarR family winged helix-turn-helix transcriptional regulator [bacterium]|nr:MarR family winged helix-turn-helix transcriptional regulator [bacterium]